MKSAPVKHEPEATEPAPSERRRAAADLWSWSSGLVPLSLVVIALLASVVIPARQTWVITALLRETTEMLAPARLMSAQLQSGLADEMGTLRGYALSGDTSWLRIHAVVVADNNRRLAKLAALGARLEGPFGAARLLGINPHTLRARMRKLGIDWAKYRSPSQAAEG